jgi:hypothetical protein
MSFKALDGTGNEITFSTTTDSQGAQVGSSCVTDPTTGNKMQVAQLFNADGQSPAGYAGLVTGVQFTWNGQTFDRFRGNLDMTTSAITVSGASAQTINGATQTNYNHRGAIFGVNVSQLSASTTIQFTVQGFDVVSGTWYTILQTAALSTTGFTQLTVYPGIASAANSAANSPLPRTFRVIAVIAGSGTATATVGTSKIL